MRPFDDDKVNVDIDPARPVDDLNYIGPTFAGRFRVDGFPTLQSVLDRLAASTRASNTRWLRRKLRNAQAGQCVDADSRSRAVGRFPRQYLVRPVNFFAYNSILVYATEHLPLAEHGRIPLALVPDPVPAAFPDRCLPGAPPPPAPAPVRVLRPRAPPPPAPPIPRVLRPRAPPPAPAPAPRARRPRPRLARAVPKRVSRVRRISP